MSPPLPRESAQCFKCVAVRCGVLRCVVVCCSVLQCVAVCCRAQLALGCLAGSAQCSRCVAGSYVISRTSVELVRAIPRAEVDVVGAQVGSFCNLSMCGTFLLRLLLPNSKRNWK